ncbi:TRAP transporter substrate-binding protein [Bradyrhizobium cenepequi]|uniref:TRAP transporter substrate-binding protein n=1 Tax=Bradyrhizobium cenepequi TaxID=2821403 RepID=UPI001CE2673E|nr:TRAP transporter substrate-binding protein [Bradyrhizobium cenepequi]MCA6108613.1 TRAP transporter substrate-binding protein [Bradyrhizobium cenepequi]
MQRRTFLKKAAVGLAATTVAAPAVAQSPGQVRWRMATSWPKSLDTMYGSADEMCKRIGQLTDGKFTIQCFAAGEVVGGLQVFDAVSNKTIECGHTLTSFYFGKDPVYAFDAGVAFGTNSRQQAAWMYYGGGLDILREVFLKQKLLNFPCGNVGVQMGGWYRKEINTPEDLKGLRMRIGGLGGVVLQRLGAIPTQIAAGDIYPSLERGTIDAAEWIGPYDDEKLGFHKVAPYYYTPGWWEGSAMITSLVNTDAWHDLPQAYKNAFEAAANEQNLLMLAKYDFKNPAALKRLIASGTKLRAFPQPVLEACYKATGETFNELSGKSADFKRVYEHWKEFINTSNQWFQMAEYRLDAFRYSSTKW